MNTFKTALTVASALAVGVTFAEVKLATPFNDGMVLQRDTKVRVWGTADAGEKVTVTFGDATVSAAADAKGNWLAELPPMAACKTGRTLAVNNLRISDVLVGEVWMFSGQSNTDCPIWGARPRYRDGWGAMTLLSTDKPFVRMVKTPLVMSPEPRYDYRANWMKMTPELFKDFENGVRLPSAMGYYFALELANALDIPVGIVDSSWGGTNIDSWTPRCGYDGLKGLDIERDWKCVSQNDWKKEMARSPISRAVNQPRVLWNGMVAAYVPMSIRGFIWYQGCTNSGEWQRYANKMHALYNGWAKEFRNPELSLYFVQLAPWGRPGIENIQMAQAKFAAEEKNAAMAVINDVGNLADIHPNDKRTVAKRLSLHALKRNYGWNWIRNESPTLKSWKIENGRFVLSFNDAQGWYVYNPDRSVKTGFEICGADGKWMPAKIVNLVGSRDRNNNVIYRGEVKGKDLIISADGVKEPKKLRYLHSAPWFGAVYNEACLPLGAFRIGE